MKENGGERSCHLLNRNKQYVRPFSGILRYELININIKLNKLILILLQCLTKYYQTLLCYDFPEIYFNNTLTKQYVSTMFGNEKYRVNFSMILFGCMHEVCMFLLFNGDIEKKL